MSTAIYMYYYRTDSTDSSSFDSTWYRVYTVGLYLIALIYLVLVAIETRKTLYGVYTTYPASKEYDCLFIYLRGVEIEPNKSFGRNRFVYLSLLAAMKFCCVKLSDLY
jgi:hypothetical protein